MIANNNDCHQQWARTTSADRSDRRREAPTEVTDRSDRRLSRPPLLVRKKKEHNQEDTIARWLRSPGRNGDEYGHLGTWTLDTGHCHETGHAGTNWNQPRFKELVGTSSPLARPKGSLSFFPVSPSISVKSQPHMDQDQYTYITGCVQPVYRLYRLRISCTRNLSAQLILKHDAFIYFQVILVFLPN